MHYYLSNMFGLIIIIGFFRKNVQIRKHFNSDVVVKVFPEDGYFY